MAELSLFDSTIEMSELVQYIERVADQKCTGYHFSWGMSKGAAGHKTYSAILVVQTKLNKSARQILNGSSVREILDQVTEFLKTL
ncbi:hypothetical protein WSM22_03200 [Cytophagales bacterium WSM2-2]|nr:hypothetical protein WSM22_03200 [Cytophagales bacterium WSM2-2]